MATRMQQRRGTAAEWTSADPVLAAGEIGYETDTGRFKFGDGVTSWSSIEYFSSANDIIDGAPAALDTLNELAAALNDDENFAATVTAALDLRVKGYAQTASDWSTDTDPVLPLSILIETDTGKFKVNSSTSNNNAFADLDYAVLQNDFDSVISPITTDVQNNSTDIATLQGDVSSLNTTTATNVSNIGTLDAALTTLDGQVSTNISDIATLQSDMSTAQSDIIANTGNISTNSSDITTLQSDVTTAQADIATNSSDISTLQSDVSTVTTSAATNATDISNAQSDIANLQSSKADLADPTFTGNVTLPSTTDIGTVTAGEIAHLSGVTNGIQTQIDTKLASTTAASTYAPLSAPTFTGTVSLPGTTSIGDVDATEIGHLNGVTSAIQTQLDAKAPIADPTFTGTVSGVTKSMVGLSNVDNTSDLDKPVSTATQTALNAKLDLAGGTMTGKITLDGDPTQALHAVTKQYADSISEGLHIHASVVALSDSNIDLTGTSPTTVIDGVTLADGDRVIINGQTAPAENGIYVYTLTGSVFNRAADFDEPGEVSGGDFVFVTGGTNYENTGWVKTSDTVATIGTDPINFTQFSGAGSVTGGTNIEVTGTQVAVVDAPTFAGTVDASAAGVAFSDGTQTQAGVPSLTAFVEKTSGYTLDTLDHKDNVVEMNSGSAVTFTIPTDANLSWPVGASMDIFQTGAGQVTIDVADSGTTTLNFTPGNKLRTQWSSATIMKRGANNWVLYGDLTA
jgi:hypothetical protein